MSTITSDRIPVCDADGVIVERADPSRVRRLMLAPNVTAIRKGIRKGPSECREIVRIMLGSESPRQFLAASEIDEQLDPSKRANARAMSHDHETKDNPEKVWTLKR